MAPYTPPIATGSPVPRSAVPRSVPDPETFQGFISNIDDLRLRFLTRETFNAARQFWAEITPHACYDALRAHHDSMELALFELRNLRHTNVVPCRPPAKKAEEQAKPRDIAIRDIRSFRLRNLTQATRNFVIRAKPNITNRACRDAVLLNRMSITGAVDALLADDATGSDAPTTFPKFGQLPCELRLAIWREATLEANKDRIVLMDDVRDRCLRVSEQLRPDAVFMATRESRQVARSIYNTRLDVFACCSFGSDGAVSITAETDYWMDESCTVDVKYRGAVYVSLQHDRFAGLLPTDMIFEVDHDITGDTTQHLSSRLSQKDLAHIENIMEIETLLTGDLWSGSDCDECMERWQEMLEEPCEGCGGFHDSNLDLETVLSTCDHVPPFDYFVEQVCEGLCHRTCLKKYPALRSCVHVWVDADRDADPTEFLQAICDEPANEVMVAWEEHMRHYGLDDILRSVSDCKDDESEDSLAGVSPMSGCL